MTDKEFIDISKKFLLYSFKDVEDYNELTILEKIICPEEKYKKLKAYLAKQEEERK